MLFEEASSPLSSKSLLLNPKISELLLPVLCSTLKEIQSIEKMNKNLTRSDMTILVDAESKWHPLEK